MNKVRHSQASWFTVLMTACLLVSLVLLLGVNRGILASIVLTCLAYAFLRTQTLKGFLLFEFALVAGLWLFTLYDLGTTGPYTRWFNERLLSRASEANLVGDSEDKVEKVLGQADQIEISPLSPGKDYIYAPFPHFPAAAVQVHCADGKVVGIDLYDD